MKKILCTLLACTIGVSAVAALAGCGCNSDKPSGSSQSQNSEAGYKVVATDPDLKNDTFGFYILNDKEVMLTRYFGSQSQVEIPDTFQNYTVTTIGHSVFDNDGITSITVPDTVTDIKDYAFASNKNLTSVKLPSKLEFLGTNAFFYCTKLETVELPASLKKIDSFAFSASGVKTMTIPESQTLTELPEYMFHQCPNLKEVTIPATITTIPETAFSQCPKDLVIKAPSGSAAETFANEQGIKFEAV